MQKIHIYILYHIAIVVIAYVYGNFILDSQLSILMLSVGMLNTVYSNIIN